MSKKAQTIEWVSVSETPEVDREYLVATSHGVHVMRLLRSGDELLWFNGDGRRCGYKIAQFWAHLPSTPVVRTHNISLCSVKLATICAALQQRAQYLTCEDDNYQAVASGGGVYTPLDTNAIEDLISELRLTAGLCRE